jgi:hypothetical protein
MKAVTSSSSTNETRVQEEDNMPHIVQEEVLEHTAY